MKGSGCCGGGLGTSAGVTRYPKMTQVRFLTSTLLKRGMSSALQTHLLAVSTFANLGSWARALERLRPVSFFRQVGSHQND